MHPGRPCYVLRQAFLGGLVEDANAVVDAKARVLPRQQVSGEVLVQEFALHQQRDHPPPENLDHGLQPGERDEKEGPFNPCRKSLSGSVVISTERSDTSTLLAC
jgi:hypothetical protein